MCVLRKSKIRQMLNEGRLRISPFCEYRLQPVSYDVSITDRLMVYEDTVLDMRKKPTTREIVIPDRGYTLEPDEFYLASTLELVGSSEFFCRISGKSSAGRLGVEIHRTAGEGDPGFYGTWTLEMSVIKPLTIYPYDVLAQVYFMTAVGECVPEDLYDGKYQDQDGIVPSRAWLDQHRS